MQLRAGTKHLQPTVMGMIWKSSLGVPSFRSPVPHSNRRIPRALGSLGKPTSFWSISTGIM